MFIYYCSYSIPPIYLWKQWYVHGFSIGAVMANGKSMNKLGRWSLGHDSTGMGLQ